MKNPAFRKRNRNRKRTILCLLSAISYLLVSGPARADDEDELADVVAAVYKPRGTAFLSENMALTQEGTIFKAGNMYLTPRGTIFKFGHTYLGPRETVYRSGDTFLGSRSTTFKSGDTYLNSRGSTFRSGSVLLGPDE